MSNRTPAQERAVTSTSPTILAIAGPGSGKTKTTVDRIWHLIETGTNPEHIVAITFTNAAARELEERIAKACPEDHLPPRLGYVGTLHGFALRMLKQYGTDLGYGDRMSIISPESAEDLLQSKADALGCKTKLKDLLKLKSLGRPVTHIQAPGHPAERRRLTVEETVIQSYYQDLAEAGIVDFDVMLEEFARMVTNGFLPESYTHLFVDEVQDSARIDWAIYLGLPIANKFFVGDPDQAIYAFRGGDLNGILQLAARPDVEVIQLEANFRSHSEICEAADRLIGHNTNRVAKRTISAKGPGGCVDILEATGNEGEEAAKICHSLKNDGWLYDEIAVLTRTNNQAFEIQKQLEAAGLPVIKREKSTLPRDWSYARATIELMANPDNDTLAYFYLMARYQAVGDTPGEARKAANIARRTAAASGKTINAQSISLRAGLTPTEALQSMGSVSAEARMLMAQIAKETQPETVLDLALACANHRETVEEAKDQQPHGIHCITIHAAKGREFDAVYLAGMEDELMPGSKADDNNVEEERRLAFVAITRARQFLMITHAARRTTSWGAIQSRTPSRFIAELAGPGKP